MGPDYVEGDTYARDRIGDDARHFQILSRLTIGLFLAFLLFAVILGFTGSSGWLAATVVTGLLWIGAAAHDSFRRLFAVMAINEHRIRLLEQRTRDTSLTVEDIKRVQRKHFTWDNL